MLISLPYKCLLVSGKDAESYLNQRLTGRIDSVDTLLPNFALTPAGKIEGFYRVAKLENTFLITCEVDSGVDDALNALLRFKVSEKITVQICDELKLYHGFEKEMIRTDLIFKSLRTETWGYDFLTREELEARTFDDEHFNFSRISANQPRIFSDTGHGINFVELTNDFFAPKTGICYVGQEVFEKAKSVGRPPSYVVPFQLETRISSSISKEIEVIDTDSGTRLGNVLSLYQGITGFCRLKFVKSEVGFRLRNQVLLAKVKS